MRLEAFTQWRLHPWYRVGQAAPHHQKPQPPAPALIRDAMAAAHSPQCTTAAQEQFRLSHSTAVISKETSISVQHLPEKYPTQVRAHGGAANLAAKGSAHILSRRKGKHPKQVATNTTLK